MVRQTNSSCPLTYAPSRMKPNYRRCISCRKVALKEEFWRLIRIYPSHQLQLDQGMGRSAYLCKQESCLTAARKKNRLGRALKAPIPEEVYETLRQRLVTVTDNPDLTGSSMATDTRPTRQPENAPG